MKKRYYISVDCEGAACVVGRPEQGLGEEGNYRFACREATRETNAAVHALFDAGADDVLVWDSHGTGVNLDYDLLDTRCRIVLGSGHKGRFVGLNGNFTAVLFVGYHAMAGTQDAVLSHTFSSKAFQWCKLNGELAGELAIDAAYAGVYGVPVLFCSSDDRCIAEAQRTFGPISCVVTKQSLSWNSAISFHPAAVCEDIYRTVLAAAKAGPCVPPYTLPEPLRVEIRYQRTDSAAQASLFDCEGRPFAFTDAYTRFGTVNSICDLF